MGTILLVLKWFLLIISIISLLNFIKKSTNKQVSEQENKNLSALITLTIIVWVIGFFIHPVNNVEQPKTKEKELSTEQVTRPSDFLNKPENVETLINESLDDKDVTLVEVRPIQDEDSVSLDLIFDVDPESFRKKLQINITMHEILSIIKEYDYSKYSGINFFYSTNLIDDLGNEKSVIVAKSKYSKETLDKMNIQNLTLVTIGNAADKYWIHPAIDK